MLFDIFAKNARKAKFFFIYKISNILFLIKKTSHASRRPMMASGGTIIST